MIITRTKENKIRAYTDYSSYDHCLSQKPEEYNSIDKQIILFRGRSSLRHYMPNKPHKWGFKVFSRNGTSCILYDFELEGAPNPARKEQVEEPGYCGADVVIQK